MLQTAATPDVIDALRRAVGENAVRTDDATLRLFSQDVYRAGALPLAVLRPTTIAALRAGVAAATQAGLAIFPRGGGMSYTDAFLPTSSQSVVLDTGALNRVIEINATDLYVTAEAGVTWAQLDEALKPHGVRAAFWGPMSGRIATIGGACSQGAATFGSGRHGVSGQAVLGFDVVLADGRLIRTGSVGQPHHTPFFRHYGPDLTGLFAADAGALGIKATVTLALEPRPAVGTGLSFSFQSFAGLHAGIVAAARDGLATEIFGAETALVRMVAGDLNLRRDLATLWGVVGAAPNVIAGLARSARIVLAGRGFLSGSQYLVNALTEAPDARRLAALEADLRAAMGEGTEIANTVPTITRAMPFPDPMVLGPEGRRLLPLHGIFAPSRVVAFHTEMMAWRAAAQADLDRLGIMVPVVYASVGRNGFLYEPVIYWRDAWPDLHRHTMPPALLAQMKPGADNPAARLKVEEVRQTLVAMMYRHGATHLQIGRAYPYLREREPAFVDVLRALKREVDPRNLINPGALGL